MSEKRNVLFIVVDTLRADMCFGEDRAVKTPTIDYLKERGTSFTQAIATGSVTTATVATMLTGLYPFLHGVVANLFEEGGNTPPAALNPRCATLPEVLQKNGYHTYAMVTGPLVEAWALDRGFEEYAYRDVRDTIYTDWGKQLKEAVGNGTLKKPWFLFLHLWEVHLPRTVLRSFRGGQYGRNRYEKALSCLDHHLRDLIDLLDFDETILFIHGDHGENYDYPPRFARPLYTKAGYFLCARLPILKALRYLRRTYFAPHLPKDGVGWVSHGNYLYDFLVRVPLIAVGNGVFPAGKIIGDQISQADILPTILDAVGLSDHLDQRIHGRSLMPLAEGKSLPERPVLLQTGRRIAIRKPEWKLIVDRTSPDKSELFNLAVDPTEDSNLIGEERDTFGMLKRELEAILSLDYEEISSAPSEMTVEEREGVEKKLRDLGYM